MQKATESWTIFVIVYGIVVAMAALVAIYADTAQYWINIFAVAQFFLIYAVVLGLIPRLDRSDGVATLSRRTALWVFLISAALNIFCCAMFHFQLGLKDTTCVEEAGCSLDFRDALYFSIVTFTTLGFGDFQPVPETRLLAAFQALTGYLYLGLGIGIAAGGFKPAGQR